MKNLPRIFLFFV